MARCEAIELTGAQDVHVIALDLEKLGEVKKVLTRRGTEIWISEWLWCMDSHTRPQIWVYGRRLPKWVRVEGIDAYPLWVPRYGLQDGTNAGLPGELPYPWRT